MTRLYGVPVREYPRRSFGEVVMWSHATGAGALAACDDVLTAIADVRHAHEADRVMLRAAAYYWARSTWKQVWLRPVCCAKCEGNRIWKKVHNVRRRINMGWWETVGGAVIGDPAADYVEQLQAMGIVLVEPDDLPWKVRERLVALYTEGIGRSPTDGDLRALLHFCV